MRCVLLLRYVLISALLLTSGTKTYAHDCQSMELELVKGEPLRQALVVLADHHDQDTNYAVLNSYDNTIFEITPLQLDAINGDFFFRAKKAGKAVVRINWAYQPTMFEGFCDVKVTVVEAQSTAGAPNSGSDADPVDTFSGELYMHEDRPDLDLGGPMPLKFERYYGGYLRRGFVLGDLGNNWRHNFDATLKRNGTRAVYTSWKGRVVLFDNSNGDWVQQGKSDVSYQLVMDSGEDARLYDPENRRIYYFDYTDGGPTLGKLVKVGDGRGNEHTVAYDDNGRMQALSDGLGRNMIVSYNNDFIPKVSAVSAATRTVQFLYQDSNDDENLSHFLDARGNTTQYRYADTSGSADRALMLSRQRPEMNIPYRQTFFTTADQFVSGRVKTQVDADGHATDFSYDSNSLLTTVTNVDEGVTRQHMHNGDGELLTYTDESGEQIDVAYTASGHRRQVVDRDGNTTGRTIDAASGKTAGVNYPDNSSLGNIYTPRTLDGITFYDLTRINYPDGSAEIFTYDAMGNALSRTTRRGVTWSWTYNGNGQMLTATNGVGGVTSFAYNAEGSRASVEYPTGEVTAFSYDALHRLNKLSHADGSFRIFSYDANDNLIQISDELANITLFDYDLNNNLVGSTDALGQSIVMEYDGLDRLVLIRNGTTEETVFNYNALGQLASVDSPDGAVTEYSYDDLGRLIGLTDGEQRSWIRELSGEGIETANIDPLGNRTAHNLDANGLAVATISARGYTTTHLRDEMGRISSSIDPLGNMTQLGRDNGGLLTSVMLPGAVSKASYVRDGLSLVTEIVDAANNTWKRNRDVAGRPLSFVDPLGNTSSFTYTNRNQLDAISFPDSLGTANYSYDLAGRMTQASYSDGTSFSYTYDPLHRLLSSKGITLAYQRSSNWLNETNGLLISRNPRGTIASLQLAMGRTINYSYDATDRVSKITDWTGAETDITYDGAGRLKTISRPNGIVTSYSYDADSRINAVTEAASTGAISSVILIRDAAGRIISANRQGVLAAEPGMPITEAHQYDAASQLDGYDYDAQGKLVSDGGNNFAWNLASQLTAISGDNSASFQYDAFGGLTQSNSNGVSRDYVWNYALSLPSMSVLRENSVDKRYYIHTPEGFLLYSLEAADNTRRDYHYDEGGNTLFLSDSSGATTDSYAYSPYGRLLGHIGSSDNLFTWQGAYGIAQMAVNDLYYMRARWYDATAARFLSRDPALLMTPIELNPYQYASIDPLQNHDPSGRAPEAIDKPEEPAEFDISSIMTVCGSGTAADPYTLSEQEFSRIMTAEIVSDIIKKGQSADFGEYDPSIPMALDSPFVTTKGGLQQKQFSFRGRTMIGGDLNYYLQGWYWAHIGLPRTAMIEIINAYKQKKYGCDANPDALFAALEGWKDRSGSGFTPNATIEFLHDGGTSGILGPTVERAVIRGLTNLFTPAGKKK